MSTDLNTDVIVLTGMHRSGTTFLGQVFKETNMFDVLHEPFNRKYGVKNLRYDYIDLGADENNTKKNVLQNISTFKKLSFVRKSWRDNNIQALARLVVGGRTEREWRSIRTKQLLRTKPIVLKDPFLSMSTNLLTEVAQIKTIYMVRHPCAVWNSINAMGWSMDLNFFSSQHYSEKFKTLDKASELEKFCAVWKAIHSVNARIKNDNFMTLTHENLCFNPEKVISDCFGFIGVEDQKTIKQVVEKYMSSERSTKKERQLHDFKRSPAELVNSWKNKLNKSDIDYILSECSELIESSYGKING